ncbi:serine/threonine-protein kinase-like protein acr4 [Quercus suber]|uniref:Serine/threonine-protein kinase-like protein acr4 n=1 Tax=Quercus suber TaxID=58331 RepID=A0AAW0JZP5_QUESU
MNHTQYIVYCFVMVSLSISLIILGIVLYLICKKRPVESEESLPIKLVARAYTLTDIDAATDGFNHRRIVGQGRLGTVMPPYLKNKLQLLSGFIPGLIGFSTVIKSLSLAQHPHIVSILGFSEAPGERIIVMDFVGMVKILSGRVSEEGLLVKWALPLIKEMKLSELLDPRQVFPSDVKPLVRMAKVASSCVGNSRKSRPSIGQVATILNSLEMELRV